MTKLVKRLLLNPWSALITLAIVLTIRALDPQLVESVRLRYFDTLIAQKPQTENAVVILDIDEDALEQWGQWPLPRQQYARLIEELYHRGAGLVVLNVLMADSDRSGGDQRLAAAMKKWPVILPSTAHSKSRNQAREPQMVVINTQFADQIVSYPGIISNIPQLESTAQGVGLVNTLPEVDGVNRRIPLVANVGQRVYPSLAVEILRVATDSSPQIKLFQQGVEKFRIPKIGAIATDGWGRIWIDWSQTSKNFTVTNYPQDLAGAVVIVGATAPGISNPVPTSIGAQYPHHVQAAVLGTLMNGVAIQRPDWAAGGELLLLLLAGLCLIFTARWTYVGLGAATFLLGSSVLGSWIAFHHYLFLLDATAISTGLVLVALHVYSIKFIREYMQKQQIKKQFSTYLSPDLVAKLIKDPSLLKLGGEEKELSVMFTDVRGFTGISEHYGKNVQGLTSIMNRYMTAMTKKILENYGTLDKYIGDAQMAFWNAPLDETKHCKDAVKSALEMLDELKTFNEEIGKEGVPPFGMGIGINTGVVVVGNMGSQQRFDYTCLGDAVNLASRLEGQSKNYGVLIVLGPVTAQRVEKDFFTVKLDCIAVKGKTQGVDIYTVFRNPPQEKIALWWERRRAHMQLLEHYKNREWKQARELSAYLKGSFDGALDQYYDIWQKRINDLSTQNLPEDWDGVYRAETK
jgi:adenylate cyclase